MCVCFFSYANRSGSASALINDNSLGDGEGDGDDDSAGDDVGRGDTKETNLVLPGSDVTQHRWKKCAALKESQTDITTQEEFYKFDFQVTWSQNSIAQFILIFAAMLSFSSNFT